MSKPKRPQQSKPGAKPGTKPGTKPGSSGTARTTTRTTGTVAMAGGAARPITSAAQVQARTAGGAGRTTPTSARLQARTAYANNRRRGGQVPWWRTPWAVIGFPIVAILLVVTFFIYLASHGGSSGIAAQPVPVDVLHGVTKVSDNTFSGVGTGEVANPLTAVTPGVPILRDSAGKPILLYVGAEYCPYCAAERWSMVIALNRFGSFSNLHIISSSSTDAFPNTPTFTFYQSTYASQYVDFQPVEVQDRNGNALQTMTSAQSKLFSKYNSQGSFPFLDFGNQYIAIGASYSNNVLTDQDWHSIAKLLNNSGSPVTQSIVGTANYMTAAICQINGNKPASVCGAAPIPAIEKTIGKPAGS